MVKVSLSVALPLFTTLSRAVCPPLKFVEAEVKAWPLSSGADKEKSATTLRLENRREFQTCLRVIIRTVP
jgi:hypothetical protein